MHTAIQEALRVLHTHEIMRVMSNRNPEPKRMRINRRREIKILPASLDSTVMKIIMGEGEGEQNNEGTRAFGQLGVMELVA